MSKLLIQGELYAPIKVGDEGDWYEGEPDSECGDFGEKYGKLHLSQCDIERCPACGGQLLSCDCGPVFDVDENIDEESLNAHIEKQKRMIAAKSIIVKYNSAGPQGNIYEIMGLAKKALKEHNRKAQYSEMWQRVIEAQNYRKALGIINEYVTLIDVARQPEM